MGLPIPQKRIIGAAASSLGLSGGDGGGSGLGAGLAYTPSGIPGHAGVVNHPYVGSGNYIVGFFANPSGTHFARQIHGETGGSFKLFQFQTPDDYSSGLLLQSIELSSFVGDLFQISDDGVHLITSYYGKLRRYDNSTPWDFTTKGAAIDIITDNGLDACLSKDGTKLFVNFGDDYLHEFALPAPWSAPVSIDPINAVASVYLPNVDYDNFKELKPGYLVTYDYPTGYRIISFTDGDLSTAQVTGVIHPPPDNTSGQWIAQYVERTNTILWMTYSQRTTLYEQKLG